MKQYEYIVGCHETNNGTTLIKVEVPIKARKRDVMENLKMAAKYAQIEVSHWEEFSAEERAKYDEHLEVMGNMRGGCDGDQAFCYYLKEFCGYKITRIPKVDFEFEW